MSEATSRKRRRGPSEASNDQPVDVGGAPDAADAVPEHPSVGQLAQQVLQMQSVLAASVQQMQMQQMQSVLAASMQQIDTRTARIESAVQQMQQQTAASVQQMEARINESIQQMEERVGRGVVAPPPQLQQTQQGAANETCGTSVPNSTYSHRTHPTYLARMAVVTSSPSPSPAFRHQGCRAQSLLKEEEGREAPYR
eukprot:GHVU01196879.1.p2 GENE.GHVU01196879.1~~GHVU01196879.1.p2  ORF type:complete len:197 (+),score=40.97 GHVU01196879.1:127-717(+)